MSHLVYSPKELIEPIKECIELDGYTPHIERFKFLVETAIEKNQEEILIDDKDLDLIRIYLPEKE